MHYTLSQKHFRDSTRMEPMVHKTSEQFRHLYLIFRTAALLAHLISNHGRGTCNHAYVWLAAALILASTSLFFAVLKPYKVNYLNAIDSLLCFCQVYNYCQFYFCCTCRTKSTATLHTSALPSPPPSPPLPHPVTEVCVASDNTNTGIVGFNYWTRRTVWATVWAAEMGIATHKVWGCQPHTKFGAVSLTQAHLTHAQEEPGLQVN